MNTPWLDTGVRKAAIASISGYQKYISPHKGFSCAYRLLHGGESCSGYVKSMVAQQGLAAAIKAAHSRFQDCREANQILRARINNSGLPGQDNRKKDKKKSIQSPDYCAVLGTDANCCECGLDSLECASSLPCDIPSCDLPDCGAIDCGSGADCCSALDCGGCG